MATVTVTAGYVPNNGLNFGLNLAIALFAFALGALVLETIGLESPIFHTILDTSVFLTGGLVALLLWDVGTRTQDAQPLFVAIAFAVLAMGELVHTVAALQWEVAPFGYSEVQWRAGTWGPPAHLLPIGIGAALLLRGRDKRYAWFLAAGLMILAALLFVVFQLVPRYRAPGLFGITRPSLILVPMLWAAVGLGYWRLREESEIAYALSLTAIVLMIAHVVMLYSRAPDDPTAMTAHLGKVIGDLLLLFSLTQIGAADTTRRKLAERELVRVNQSLEQFVRDRTAQLETANASLQFEIRQREEAQQNLAKREELFRVSFESAAVGKAQADLETGRIIRANRAFARMLGYEPEDLVGRDVWEFTWPGDLDSQKTEYARVVRGEVGAYVREKRYIRKDGTPIWGRVSATVVRFPESGQRSITIAVIEDIDERRKVREALEAAKCDLEDVVKERTAALLQRDLLLREVYHRVKNNLQLIDSLLLMQVRQLSDPDAKIALQSLRNRVYALGLVHHQLMGSDNLKTFDIAPFLQELSNNLIKGSAGRNISLSVRAMPLDVGLDFAIPLGLLVTELVTNSLKHAFPDGNGNIDVTLDRSETGNIALVVSDNGRGNRSAGTASEVRKMGLGSSIIESLVAQLEGTILVQNANGTRSEICVAAPVVA